MAVKPLVRVSRFAVFLALVPLALTAEKTASQLAKEAARAELNGNVVQAYLLYCEAAAKDPANQLLWLHAQTLRPIAEAKQKRSAAQQTKLSSETKVPIDPSIVGSITDQEVAESRRLLPPPEVEGSPGTKNFDLRGDAKLLFQKVAAAFGLEAVFDGAYDAKTGLHLELTDSDFRDAIRSVEAATGSFVVPISEKKFLVANENVTKRTEFDRTASMVIPVPEPFSVQEVQEIATGVRGTLDIQRLMVDTNRRLLLIRDRVTKVQLAQKLIRDLMRPKAQVSVDVEMTEVDYNSSLNYGLSLPNSFALVWFGAPNSTTVTTNYPSGYSSYLGFGGGKSFLGLGITNAGLFATVSKGSSTTLLKSEIVTSDGQAATLHVGDKYPIVTSGYFGATTTSGTVYTPPPTINFEDLGLVMKITPHVHGADEMSLDVEAEFKLLGSTSVDNIPVISSRKFESKVRVREGEWAVLAGLMNDSEGKTVSALAGLHVIPLLRNNTITKTRGDTLIILKPHLLSLPPTETATKPAWVGSETHPRSAI